MGVRSFFDSNILVYTDDHDAPKKQTAALNLVEEARLQRSGVISTQVLHRPKRTIASMSQTSEPR